MKPTTNSPRQRPGRPGRWRRRLGALAAIAALLTAGTVVAPGAAQADPCWTCWPPPPTVPCTELGPIVWHDDTTGGLYAKNGVKFDVVSTTPVFDVAYGRFNENRTDQVITGSWTASQSRTITMTSSFNFSLSVATGEELRTTVTAATGIQVTESRTTMVGVGATAPVPPHSTVLGEYGLQSLDVVFHARRVYLRHDLQYCVLAREPELNQTAHIPTINEGWRFTRI